MESAVTTPRISKSPPAAQTKDVILLIADISGYTRFMLSNQMDLAHSQWIISQLIKTIIKQVELPVEVAKLEGDAIFLYAIKEGDATAIEATKQIVQEKLPIFFATFSNKVVELSQSNTCDCNACRHVDRLRLKVVAHSGKALFYQVDKFFELAGPDVITVHRLLKNSVAADEYILFTEAAYTDLDLEKNLDVVKGEECYENIEPLTTYTHFPHITEKYFTEVEEAQPYTSTIYQIKTAINLQVNMLLMDWGLKKRPDLQSFGQVKAKTKVRGWDLSLLLTILRVALGLVVITGGIKLAFPGDPQALAAAYTDPMSGYISTFFVAKIGETFGLSISLFLRLLGGMEIVTGILLIHGGLNTQMTAAMVAVMFWAFTVANPVVGEIRLSRDIGLAGISIAVALTGPNGWGLDGTFKRYDTVMLIIRLSLAYTLIAATVFTGGVFANPLNTTLPILLVLFLGMLLLSGIFPRWVMLFIVVWLLYIMGSSLIDNGIYGGLDPVKREIGLLAAAFVYFIAGPDRRAWPKARLR